MESTVCSFFSCEVFMVVVVMPLFCRCVVVNCYFGDGLKMLGI